MNIAYITSMFPCWSETFVLNEIVEHQNAGCEVSILSLKKCSEDVIQDKAVYFRNKTIYASVSLKLRTVILHLYWLYKKPMVYLKILFKIILLRPFTSEVKIKSLVVFWISPLFISSIRSGSVEHLHAHFATYPALLARIINAFIDIPYSFTAHAHDIYVNTTLLALVARRAKFIATISSYNFEILASKLPWFSLSNVRIIHCGIDLTQFQFKENKLSCDNHQNVLQILSVGRLSGIKGFPYLLDALSQLTNRGQKYFCKIIGDGPDMNSLQKCVMDLDLKDSVLFLGAKRTEEVRRYMEESDVFVLACATSPKEGQDGIPVVFMEAMALGTPVIGTALSGIPELIKNGETGLLALPENALSLCDTISYFVEHPVEVEYMRRKARKLIEEEFNILKTSEQLRTEISL